MLRHLRLLAALLIISACAGNANRSSLNEQDGDLPFNPGREPFDPDTKSSLGSALSNGSGGLTSADQTALKALFDETDDVNTNDELAALSEAVQAEFKRIQDEERRTGTLMAGRRVQLMQSAFQDCTRRAAEGGPKPGQTLQGRWEGHGCATNAKKSRGTKKSKDAAGPALMINIAGQASPNRFPVSGATSGVMGAQKDGTGVIAAQPWAGQLSDHTFTGVLNHPKYQRKNGQDYPCTMEVGLRASTNPIPENHVLAMKVMGKCYKQALFLANPMLDNAFKKMDPALVQLLQNKMLGIR